MPIVPTYQRQTVQPAAMPDAHVSMPEMPDVAGQQTQQLSQGLMRAGQGTAQVATDIAQQANQVRVQDAGNQAVRAFVDTSTKFSTLKGADALQPDAQGNLPLDNAQKALGDQLAQIRGTLSNDAQRQAFDQHAGLIGRFQADAAGPLVAQQKVYNDSVQDGTIQTSQQLMAANPEKPEVVDQSLNAIKYAVAQKAQGLAPEYVQAVQDQAVTAAHAATIQTLLDSKNTDGAVAYFNQYKDTIQPIQRAKLQEQIGTADVGNAAIKGADQIWSQIGPKDSSDNPDVFAMDKAARDLYAGSSEKIKATVAEIHQRVADFSASQNAAQAGSLNDVYDQFNKGAGLNSIRQSTAFTSLDPKMQTQVIDSLQNIQHSRYARNLEDQQLAQTTLVRQNYGTYLDLVAHPDKLAAMTPDQITGMLPQLGRELTTQVLDARMRLDTQAGKLQGRMDANDFNSVAEEFGLDPYASGKTADQKAQLGMLRSRVDQLIGQQQQASKTPMTQQQKIDLMRQEVSRTVTVDPGWFSFNQDVPVISLTPEQAGQVVIPTADRAQISKLLQGKAQQFPGNPNYAPTEQNIRRIYLQARSPAGAMINAK